MTSTIDDVQSWLRELARWTPLLPATWSDTPMRASRTGDGIHVRLSHAQMPGGMERAIDTWDLNGKFGIHTQIGVQQALGPWADELRTLRDMLIGPDPHTGTIPYLLDHLDWAAQHMDHTQWELMCADIHGVHDRVQGIVWPDRERAGTCPGCGARLEWVMGDKGKINTPICPNRCRVDLRAGLPHAQRARIKRADPDHDAPAYATIEEVKTLFPEVKGGTLRKWVFEGKVRKEGSRYCINDIATRASSVPKQIAV